MAWRVKNVEDQRIEFIEEFLNDQMTVTELCEMYQISRKTSYKWIRRFKKEGVEGLVERSTAPYHRAGKTSDELAHQIANVKRKYPKGG